MKYIFELVVFCIILFFYLHINFYLKTSNDYEIYELDNITKTKLEELCNLRQPTVFNVNSELLNTCKLTNLTKNLGNLDLQIRDITDNDETSEFYIPLTLNNSIKLLNGDMENKYITERNQEFINESGLLNNFKEHNNLLKPYGTSLTSYDLLSGSKNTATPLRYEMYFRNFYYVTEGCATIKLTPSSNTKYLHVNKDYDNFEFSSAINPWNCQEKYMNDFQKVRFTEIVLYPGMMFFIPMYWFYSIKYTENTTICNFKYRTLMNTLTISPHLLFNFLQKTNIKYTTTKTVKNINKVVEENETKKSTSEKKAKKPKKKDSVEINSFGQPKSIEEIIADEGSQTTINSKQITTHDQLIKPALESPSKDSTPLSQLIPNMI